MVLDDERKAVQDWAHEYEEIIKKDVDKLNQALSCNNYGILYSFLESPPIDKIKCHAEFCTLLTNYDTLKSILYTAISILEDMRAGYSYEIPENAEQALSLACAKMLYETKEPEPESIYEMTGPFQDLIYVLYLEKSGMQNLLEQYKCCLEYQKEPNVGFFQRLFPKPKILVSRYEFEEFIGRERVPILLVMLYFEDRRRNDR